MSQDYKPLPPPKYKYTKPFNGLVALLTWVGVSIVILYFTKEGNSRQENVFIGLIVIEAFVGIVTVYQILTGKHLRQPGEPQK